MKLKKLFLIIFTIISISATAQDKEKAALLVNDGIKFHDAGKYTEALDKYREALQADAGNVVARYEMSYTFLSAQQFDSCVYYCENLKTENIPADLLRNVIVNLGSAYDYLKEPQKALKVYNEGIKKFDDFYLLHFNQGLTYLISLNDIENAEKAFQKAVILKPTHTSSHYWLFRILKDQNKIPALLAASLVAILEGNTARSKEAAGHILQALNPDIKKEGNNTTLSITLPAGFDNKRKSENNFSVVDLGLSLMAAAPLGDTLKLDQRGKFALQYSMMCGLLEGYKKQKGFYWKFYAPFFYELKEEGYVELVSNLILQANNDADATLWVQSHSKDIEKFSQWFGNFSWKGN